MTVIWFALPGVLLWAVVMALPWQPWRVRERLEASADPAADLSDVTALVPARNEAEHIARTLRGLQEQGVGLGVILIDDESSDSTRAQATGLNYDNLHILEGRPPEPGWSGKLWALHQGFDRVRTKYVLLLDADIRLEPGVIPALKRVMQARDARLVSLLARLHMQSFWEKLLLPAFVYFFRLLYPFHLSNAGAQQVAAAAGGCVLLHADSLRQAGGFAAIKGELIDDCALARQFRNAGLGTWVGLSHAAISQRRYINPAEIRNMVARTAYTQLRHSPWLLLLCSAALLCACVLPVLCLLVPDTPTRLAGLTALGLMAGSYMPTLRYYRLNPLWALTFPLAGALYLMMTWDSAWRHWSGVGASWKNRSYQPARARGR